MPLGGPDTGSDYGGSNWRLPPVVLDAVKLDFRSLVRPQMYVAVRFPDPYVLMRQLFEWDWDGDRMYVEREDEDGGYAALCAQVDVSVRVALDAMNVRVIDGPDLLAWEIYLGMRDG